MTRLANQMAPSMPLDGYCKSLWLMIKPPNQNLTRFTFTGDQIHHRFWANRVAYETSTLEGRKGWSNHCNNHNLWQIHRPTRRKNLDDFLLQVFYFRKQVCNWSHSKQNFFAKKLLSLGSSTIETSHSDPCGLSAPVDELLKTRPLKKNICYIITSLLWLLQYILL